MEGVCEQADSEENENSNGDDARAVIARDPFRQILIRYLVEYVHATFHSISWV